MSSLKNRNTGYLGVSVVVCMKTEKIETIRGLLRGLLSQSLKPDEVILIDGSEEGFAKFKYINLSETKIKYFHKPTNRSKARNLGISIAKNNLIAITDAGCYPHKNWIRNMRNCLIKNSADVVAGGYQAKSKTNFQKCLVPYVLVSPEKINEKFLPSTRSMLMTKTAWERNGKFPEEYNHNEDYVFAKRLATNRLKTIVCPNAVVSWIPRKSLKEAIIMFTRFAYGDAESGIIRPKVVLILTRYLVGAYLLYSNHITLSVKLVTLYCLWSVWKNYRKVNDKSSIYWLPILQITSDISVILGTFIGGLSFMAKRSKIK